jgi:hypothetical protein
LNHVLSDNFWLDGFKSLRVVNAFELGANWVSEHVALLQSVNKFWKGMESSGKVWGSSGRGKNEVVCTLTRLAIPWHD